MTPARSRATQVATAFDLYTSNPLSRTDFTTLINYVEQAINDAIEDERHRVNSRIQHIADHYGNQPMPLAEAMHKLQHVLSNTEDT